MPVSRTLELMRQTVERIISDSSWASFLLTVSTNQNGRRDPLALPRSQQVPRARCVRLDGPPYPAYCVWRFWFSINKSQTCRLRPSLATGPASVKSIYEIGRAHV